jgi:hypothetical protein
VTTPSGAYQHTGFRSRRLSAMREVLDEVPLSDRDRQIVASAIGAVETEWKTQHASSYEQSVAQRDAQHEQVMAAAQQIWSDADDVADAVGVGARRRPRPAAGCASAWPSTDASPPRTEASPQPTSTSPPSRP